MPSALFDCHTHTFHSPDASRDDARALCEAALRAGLAGIAVTDHCDMGSYRDRGWRERLAGSVGDAQRAREEFAGRLEVAVGVELGQPLLELPLAQEALASAPFDIVLGSLHNLRDLCDFCEVDGAHPDKSALLGQYFSELYETVCWGGFDALAHLTYPLRYLGHGADIPPVTAFEEQIRAIFGRLAQDGKALELNVSGLYRPRHGRTMPELWELKLFRACGGEYVTLGSDAHQACDVGKGLWQGAELLREAGFAHQAVYRGRVPRLHPID